MAKARYLDQQMATIGRLAEHGLVRERLASFFIDASGAEGSRPCLNPVGFGTVARPEVGQRDPREQTYASVPSRDGKIQPTAMPLWLDGHGRCRKCSNCLAWRQAIWRIRARVEVASAHRTWFCIFTIRPDRQFYYLALAREKAAARGRDLHTNDENYIFSRHAAEIGAALTKYFKRLRKNTGCNIRYVAVFEAHASGYPHIHFLLHEPTIFDVISKAKIQAEWHEGFSNVKLIGQDPAAVNYVTKYLSKDMRTRVRASLHYGEGNVNSADRRPNVRKHTSSDITSTASVEANDHPPRPAQTGVQGPALEG